MSSIQYNINIPPLIFSTNFHEDLKNLNLLKLDKIKQDTNQYFFRGYNRYKRKLLRRTPKYRYIYLIFDFLIEENIVIVISNWYKGNAAYPIAQQNSSIRISEQLLLLENRILDDIELLILNY